MPAPTPSAHSAGSDLRFRSIFESAPECVKLIARNGELIDMNPAGLRMIEAESIEAVRGRSMLDLVGPAHRQAFRDAIDAVFGGQSVRLQFEVVSPSGRRLWMDQSASPLFDAEGRVVEMIAVTRDVTAQREAEAELLRAKVAAEINRSKWDFLANVSHQLKTPINQIVGYSELLQETALEQGRNADVADHQQVVDAALRLVSMINQMLSISLLEAGKQQIEAAEFNLNELIADAVEAFRAPAAAKGNSIVTEPHMERGAWLGDHVKLDQCLRCLLSNAVKFTRDGVIVVRAGRAVVDERSWLELEVIDTGVGVDPSQREAIFRPFANGHDGLGLGLALTRQLARLMGGDVVVDSAPWQGAQFTLRVPAEFVVDVSSRPAA